MIAHLESGTCASGMNSHYIDEQVQQHATSKELSTANIQPSVTVSATSLSLQPVIAAASLTDFDPLCVKIQGTSLSDVSLPLFGALDLVSYSPGETPTSITAVSVSSRSAITAVNPVAATTSKVSESSRSRLSGFNTLHLGSSLDGMVLQASFLGDIGGGSGIENEEQSKQKDLRRSALLELEKLAKRRDSSRTMPSTSTPGQSSDGESSAELVAWPEGVVWPETEATSPESLRVSETKPATVMSIFAELETLTGTPWTSVFTYLDNVWSIVPEGQWYVYIEILDMLCHPQEELSRRGFTLAPFAEEKFKSMQKCFQCRSRLLNTLPPVQFLTSPSRWQ